MELFYQRLRQLEEQQRRSLFTLSPEQEAQQHAQLPDTSSQCIQINSISIAGITQLSQYALRSITTRYEGKCLSLNDINTVLQEITYAYAEKGFVSSRAVLEPQDLSSGILRIRVVEGHVESIEMTHDSTMNSGQLLTIFPFVKGSVLDLRDIEQGLDQLNRLPSNSATMSIAPGTGLGDSKVVIDNVQKRTWRPSIGFDNLGQDTTTKNSNSGTSTQRYENLPEWMGDIFDKAEKLNGTWENLQKDLMLSPAAFEYAHQESTQTAYATLGKGIS